jgi:3-hydroxybutyrate dehydrogenase
MTPRYALEDKTVLITGAAGGIGQALALAFDRQSAKLVLVDRITDGLPNLTDRLRDPASAVVLTADLSDDAAVAGVAQEVRQRFGRLDVLVNNAGTEYPTALDDPAPDAMVRWSALLDNNVTSMVRLTRALLALMPRGGSIINQSSIWGKTGVADFSAYVASKHAVIGLTRSLAWELAPRGIRVNAVCPGWIRTDAALRSLHSMAAREARSPQSVELELLGRQALPEMLEPEDITGVYLFLASADARALTGQSIVASNGEVMA